MWVHFKLSRIWLIVSGEDPVSKRDHGAQPRFVSSRTGDNVRHACHSSLRLKSWTGHLTGTVSPKQGCCRRLQIWRKLRTKMWVDEQKQDQAYSLGKLALDSEALQLDVKYEVVNPAAYNGGTMSLPWEVCFFLWRQRYERMPKQNRENRSQQKP